MKLGNFLIFIERRAGCFPAAVNDIEKIRTAFVKDNFIVDHVYWARENPFLRNKERFCAAAHHRTAKNYDTGEAKKAYYVEGSPYEMGFMLGWMAEEEISRMTLDYVDNMTDVVIESAGLDGEKYDFIKKHLTLLTYLLVALKVKRDIPEQYDQELQGIVDGCFSRNKFTRVIKERLWVLNVGFDCLLSIAYTGKVLGKDLSDEDLPRDHELIKELEETRKEVKKYFDDHGLDAKKTFNDLRKIGIKPEELRIPVACNGFSVFGEATVGRRHFFGRDFMFPNAGVLQDLLCVVVYNPDPEGTSEDDQFPFVSVTAPGIIGSVTGMNSRGISAGVEVMAGAILVDSQWRYDKLYGEIRGLLENGHQITHDEARELIDFLNPDGKYGEYYKGKNPRSGDGREIQIEGSVTLFDLTALTMESHFGYYCDEWVKIHFPNYI